MTELLTREPRLDPRGHTAVFGEGRASLAATAVEVFETAQAADTTMLFVSDDADPTALAALPDRDALLATGRLQLVRTADAYPHRDPARLLTAFDDVLRVALAAGRTGLHVVAENTSLVRGGDGAFADWLAWEQTTSRWQQVNPVVGVCWFDRTALGADELDRLAQVHEQVHGALRPPAFRVLRDGAGFRLVGDVDAHEVPTLVELLDATPGDAERVVDLTGAGYVHHTVFTALARPWVLTGVRPVHRRVWSALGDHTARVDLG